MIQQKHKYFLFFIRFQFRRSYFDLCKILSKSRALQVILYDNAFTKLTNRNFTKIKMRGSKIL